MGLLIKLLPLLAITFVIPKVQDISKESFNSIKNIVYAVQLKTRLNTIAEVIVAEYVHTEKFPEDFPKFVRELVTLKGEGDPAIDYWNKELQFFLDPKKEYFEVSSDGPDGSKETEDDIFVTTEIR